MVKQLKFITCLISLCIWGQYSIAATTQLFNVNLVMTGLNSLNTGLTLSITTNIPNHVYQYAGIKTNIQSPGYQTLSQRLNCTPASNGFCLFSVSDSSPALVEIGRLDLTNKQTQHIFFPQPTPIYITLCLNALGTPTSCENHLILESPPI